MSLLSMHQKLTLRNETTPPAQFRCRFLCVLKFLLVDGSKLRTWTEFYAREQLILADYPDQVTLPLQVFRIGDLAVAQWPGEIFAISGLNLKQRSPVKPLFNISMANGWYGYIPPPEQHAAGSYETWRGRTSPLATNAIPQITQAFLKLLGKTK